MSKFKQILQQSLETVEWDTDKVSLTRMKSPDGKPLEVPVRQLSEWELAQMHAVSVLRKEAGLVNGVSQYGTFTSWVCAASMFDPETGGRVFDIQTEVAEALQGWHDEDIYALSLICGPLNGMESPKVRDARTGIAIIDLQTKEEVTTLELLPVEMREGDEKDAKALFTVVDTLNTSLKKAEEQADVEKSVGNGTSVTQSDSGPTPTLDSDTGATSPTSSDT